MMTAIRYYRSNDGTTRVVVPLEHLMVVVKMTEAGTLSVKFWAGDSIEKVASFWNMTEFIPLSKDIARSYNYRAFVAIDSVLLRRQDLEAVTAAGLRGYNPGEHAFAADLAQTREEN